MEIRIGVQHSPRELALETSDSREEVLTAFKNAVDGDGLLAITDDRERSIVVPVDKVAYLEFSGDGVRKVGFGA